MMKLDYVQWISETDPNDFIRVIPSELKMIPIDGQRRAQSIRKMLDAINANTIEMMKKMRET